MRLPSHSVSQAIPKLYFFFYSTVFKRGNSPKSVNVFKKNNNNNNSNSSKNVVGILAVLMACTVKPATKNLKIKNLLA